jgi:hypothetical protein
VYVQLELSIWEDAYIYGAWFLALAKLRALHYKHLFHLSPKGRPATRARRKVTVGRHHCGAGTAGRPV